MPNWEQRHLGAPEIPPIHPKVIIAVTYGVLPGGLAIATQEVLEEAVHWARQFPGAELAFSSCQHCFEGSAEKEWRWKDDALLTHQAWLRWIIADSATNTITELQAIKRMLDARRMRPGEILIVAEPLHSRSVMHIAREVFPDARLSLKHAAVLGYQSDHVLMLARSRFGYLLANVLRHAAISLFPFRWFAWVRIPSWKS